MVFVLLLLLEVLEVDEKHSSEQQGFLLPGGTNGQMRDEVIRGGEGFLEAAGPNILDLADYFFIRSGDLKRDLLARVARAAAEEPALATFSVDLVQRHVTLSEYIETHATALPRVCDLAEVHIGVGFLDVALLIEILGLFAVVNAHFRPVAAADSTGVFSLETQEWTLTGLFFVHSHFEGAAVSGQAQAFASV